MDAARRQLVRARANYQCEYCRLPQEFSELRFHIEHIIPHQHGGTDDELNLALACPACNLHKGSNLTAIDPQTGELVRLFHPRRDIWGQHFSNEGARVVGITAVGRTTASLLQMNDAERQRIRELIATIHGQ